MQIPDYTENLLAHLPPGRAWPRERGGWLASLMEALATGLEAVHGRALDLLEEADPRTATELLPDWERSLGVTPPESATIEARRAEVFASLTEGGGQSRAAFIEQARRLGVEISIEEPRGSDGEMDCESELGAEEEADPFIWIVHAPDEAGPHLAMEARFQALKPAHTQVFFVYGS